MARVLIGATILVIAATVYTVVDCALADRRTRAMPKPLWILLILLLPVVGAALWFLVGRPRVGRPPAPRGPDDDPSFLRSSPRAPAASADDETLRRLEQDLAGIDADTDDDGEGRRR